MESIYLYSPETKGFYIRGVHNPKNIPEDVIELSKERYNLLFEGMSLGKEIVYKSRKLQLVDREVPDATWDQIRRRRDYLLTKSDWTQVSGCPLEASKVQEWRTYRQELRDLTETYEAPDMVVWPVSPAENKED